MELVIGKSYVAKSHVHVCLEGKDGDCVVADMVELPKGTYLTFDGGDDSKYRFHGEDGTEYHLHADDLDKIEEVG